MSLLLNTMYKSKIMIFDCPKGSQIAKEYR